MIVWNYSQMISCKLEWLIKPKKSSGKFFECISWTHIVWVIQYESSNWKSCSRNIINLKRQCVTSDLGERFSDFKSIKKVIQQYFKLNRNVIEIILETLESYAQDRNHAQKAWTILMDPTYHAAYHMVHIISYGPYHIISYGPYHIMLYHMVHTILYGPYHIIWSISYHMVHNISYGPYHMVHTMSYGLYHIIPCYIIWSIIWTPYDPIWTGQWAINI